MGKSSFKKEFLKFFCRMFGVPYLDLVEEVIIVGPDGKEHTFFAKIDTGAKRTSIDKKLAKKLGLLRPKGKVVVKNSLGKEKRPVTEINLKLRGKLYKVKANISDRSRLKYKVLIGKDLIKDFIILPEEK